MWRSAFFVLCSVFIVSYGRSGVNEFLFKCLCEDPVSGLVDDCCCDVATVDRLNTQQVFPLLHQLVDMPFFRYFRINLYRHCPFWPDDGMCTIRDCAVSECEDEDEVPDCWRDPTSVSLSAVEPDCEDDISGVFPEREVDSIWAFQEHISDSDGSFINLKLNPERFTGYHGSHAHRIWNAIYRENCFEEVQEGSLEGACVEKRAFYRLLSGLHASINTHVVAEYLNPGGVWGPNLTLFHQRFDKHPQYLKNMYFVYLLTLRAVLKAAPFLEQYQFDTDPEQNARSQELVSTFVRSVAGRLEMSCPVPFDEREMFKSAEGSALRAQFAAHFHNITRIMDCVGCDRCRLWGTIQVGGLGAALRLLFSETDKEDVILSRREVASLLHVMTRLSESVRAVQLFRELELEETLGTYGTWVWVALATASVAAGVVATALCWRGLRCVLGRLRRGSQHHKAQ